MTFFTTTTCDDKTAHINPKNIISIEERTVAHGPDNGKPCTRVFFGDSGFIDTFEPVDAVARGVELLLTRGED